MSRARRIDIGGEVYHCLNRTVGRQKIFLEDSDYKSFENILEETKDITDVDIFAYCIMPNHFHIVLRPHHDGGLSDFMKRLTLTHTQRYRVYTDTVGDGPLYQGRYKSFIVQDDRYLFTVLRYVERNPITAGLIKDPLDWKFSSLYRRHRGSIQQRKLLAPWIIDEPKDYLPMLKEPISGAEIEKIKESEQRGVPYGDDGYVFNMVEKYGIQSVVRGKGRPKKI